MPDVFTRRGNDSTYICDELSLTTMKDGLGDLRRQSALKRHTGKGWRNATGHQAYKATRSRPVASEQAHSVSGTVLGLARRIDPHCRQGSSSQIPTTKGTYGTVWE